MVDTYTKLLRSIRWFTRLAHIFETEELKRLAISKANHLRAELAELVSDQAEKRGRHEAL